MSEILPNTTVPLDVFLLIRNRCEDWKSLAGKLDDLLVCYRRQATERKVAGQYPPLAGKSQGCVIFRLPLPRGRDRNDSDVF